MTLTGSDSTNSTVLRAAQPETVRDYRLLCRHEEGWKEIASVAGNYQRLNRHRVPALETDALRVEITATNGDPHARIFEIRCYT